MATTEPTSEAVTSPERVTRHALVNRIYHWVAATSVLTLLGTGFLPIVGIKFPWLTAHWIAGIALTVAVLFHIFRATIVDGLANMLPDRRDMRIAGQALRRELGRTKEKPDAPGKYPLAQKLHHHAIALATLTTLVTGCMMLFRIDTPFWRRDPYWLGDDAWGIVYVLHDAGALLLITLIMVHIYFAIRPDKWWLTRSMFRGWISTDDYQARFDPEAWPRSDSPEKAAAEPSRDNP